MIDSNYLQRYLKVYYGFLEERLSAMKKLARIWVLGLVLLPMNAMSETYKCRTPDGKIGYSGQMSLDPKVKCEQIFVRKQAVIVQEPQAVTGAPVAGDTGGMPPEADPRMQPPAPGNTAPAAAPETKKPDAKNSKAEADEARKKAEKAAAEQQAQQKEKEESCKTAQANLRTYQAGGRLTKVNEKGEKVYLDDAEIKQKTEEAQKDVAKWCNT